jgi:hypothetical protein
MVTTQDVSLGTLWVRLVGPNARWAPGEDDNPALQARADAPVIGMGLVAVWVAHEVPVLVCHPSKALRAIKSKEPGTPVEELRRALREAGAVVREEPEPRRDSMP